MPSGRRNGATRTTTTGDNAVQRLKMLPSTAEQEKASVAPTAIYGAWCTLLGSTHLPLRPFKGLLLPHSPHRLCEVKFRPCGFLPAQTHAPACGRGMHSSGTWGTLGHARAIGLRSDSVHPFPVAVRPARPLWFMGRFYVDPPGFA